VGSNAVGEDKGPFSGAEVCVNLPRQIVGFGVLEYVGTLCKKASGWTAHADVSGGIEESALTFIGKRLQDNGIGQIPVSAQRHALRAQETGKPFLQSIEQRMISGCDPRAGAGQAAGFGLASACRNHIRMAGKPMVVVAAEKNVRLALEHDASAVEKA
jgi:hypothetical protein